MTDYAGNALLNPSAYLASRAGGGLPISLTGRLMSAVAPEPLATLVATDRLVLTGGPAVLHGVSCVATASGYLMLVQGVVAPVSGIVSPLWVWYFNTVNNNPIEWSDPLYMPYGGTLVYSSTGPFVVTPSATAFISALVSPI